MNNPTRDPQENHYRSLYNKHKGTTMAVSSESLAHKALRFKNVCSVFKDDTSSSLSVHEVGMGIADMNQYIIEHFPDKTITYSGTEILEEYVLESQKRFPDSVFYHRDLATSSFEDCYDYMLFSGVFHQRRNNTIGEWEQFSQNILSNAFKMCKKGIAFNFISPFVDFYQTEVYYANLPKLLNFINDHLSRFFEIKHNYALFEFTVYVYQPSYIQELHPEVEFKKYFKP